MAICTFTPYSDVFVMERLNSSYVCHQCKLQNQGGDFRASDGQMMITHLGEHLTAGHKVPDWAFARVWPVPDE
jgi:hypothetical protein